MAPSKMTTRSAHGFEVGLARRPAAALTSRLPVRRSVRSTEIASRPRAVGHCACSSTREPVTTARPVVPRRADAQGPHPRSTRRRPSTRPRRRSAWLARRTYHRGGELDDILVHLRMTSRCVMAELATPPDNARQAGAGQDPGDSGDGDAPRDAHRQVSTRFEMPNEFVDPRPDAGRAALDVARTVVRRAERTAIEVAVAESHVVPVPEPALRLACTRRPRPRGSSAASEGHPSDMLANTPTPPGAEHSRWLSPSAPPRPQPGIARCTSVVPVACRPCRASQVKAPIVVSTWPS